ncbi:hypothetical protein Ssi03_25800 [Sphaerisporangium siamense]|uniref:Scaffolding protein n=1 Tax=Sphaerisporangium siamense TaxID=795645 RepID=A0A7W7D4H5_9ACTN|nr:hypothetical protein [Sphaerisporangium siamense]MBB4700093.1 hypothetical protein [Sphaerisporangium siamense]GII84590.1 hypothetical protein Ssi03_25800 [Sphaerisporangium siamense]
MQHPLPTTPGALLGYRKNGRPIYLLAGGSGEGDAGGQNTGQPGTENTGSQGSDQGEPSGQQGQSSGQQTGQNDSGGDVASLPDWAQKLIRDARAEAASSRTNAKQQAANEARQDLAQQIGKIVGLVKGDDAPADPAKLAQQIGDLSGENRSLRTELAVFKAAAKVGADAAKLTDSRSFLAQLDKLDPSADGFDAKLRELMKKTVEDNPIYRADAAPAPRGGAEPPGRPGKTGKADNLTDAITAKLAKTGGG